MKKLTSFIPPTKQNQSLNTFFEAMRNLSNSVNTIQDSSKNDNNTTLPAIHESIGSKLFSSSNNLKTSKSKNEGSMPKTPGQLLFSSLKKKPVSSSDNKTEPKVKNFILKTKKSVKRNKFNKSSSGNLNRTFAIHSHNQTMNSFHKSRVNKSMDMFRRLKPGQHKYLGQPKAKFSVKMSKLENLHFTDENEYANSIINSKRPVNQQKYLLKNSPYMKYKLKKVRKVNLNGPKKSKSRRR